MENNNERPSDSLYSYSYVNQENKSLSEANGAQNGGMNGTGYQSGGMNGTGYQSGGYQNSYYSAGGSAGWGPYDEPQKKKKGKKPKLKKPGGFGGKLAKCAALALVFGLVGGTVFYGTGYVFDYATGNDRSQVTEQPKVTTNSSDKNSEGSIQPTSTGGGTVVSDVSDVVDNVMPSIVSITNLSQVQYRDFFGQVYNEEIPSAGSGIVVSQTDDKLYIVTNNHVVEGAQTLTVAFADDQTATAEVKGTDASTDLAVVSVNIKDIPAETLKNIKVATLGDSSTLKVGEPAIAIGNALGYGQSVTTGVISAVDREVTIMDSKNQSVTNNLVQTDAAINPGNSGGALLNIKGEVIGINSVKYSDTDVEGMGYAIPISMAEPIINDLITREAVDESKTAYLGITGVQVSEEAIETYQMPEGIFVTQVVSGSAAEKAGIRQGDIITSFDGKKVNSMETLADRLQYYEAGAQVEITIMTAKDREYVENTLTVTLGKKN